MSILEWLEYWQTAANEGFFSVCKASFQVLCWFGEATYRWLFTAPFALLLENLSNSEDFVIANIAKAILNSVTFGPLVRMPVWYMLLAAGAYFCVALAVWGIVKKIIAVAA